MNFMDIIKGRRTIRKYKQDRIDPAILRDLVDGARLAPSASNLQPLRYLIVDDPALLEKVFVNLSWAGYIRPDGDPKEGEKPVAYIVILVPGKKGPYTNHDIGLAAQSILLGAWGYGIGSCLFGAVQRENLAEEFSIPEDVEIDTVISLGYPAEESVWEDEKGSIRYYKDENNVLHVPKRKLDDIIYWNTMD
jgi:nitroreductase